MATDKKVKTLDAGQQSKELRRILYLIRYYESCIGDYATYATKNPEAERLTVCEAKLRRLIVDAQTMIRSGVVCDITKLPQSLQQISALLPASKSDQGLEVSA